MRRVPVGAVVLAGALVFMFVLTNLAGWFGDGAPRETVAADPAKPFVGTPAHDWADGDAGIVIPTVEAIGSHSVDEVTDAYAQVRDVVAAAMLETRRDHGRRLRAVPAAVRRGRPGEPARGPGGPDRPIESGSPCPN